MHYVKLSFHSSTLYTVKALMQYKDTNSVYSLKHLTPSRSILNIHHWLTYVQFLQNNVYNIVYTCRNVIHIYSLDYMMLPVLSTVQ